MVDRATKKLIDLSAVVVKTNDDIIEIISIIQEKAPKLLDGLTESNQKSIAQDLILRCYEYDEVVFQQNDPPDAYYTVIRGAISIYALNSSTALSDEQNGHRSQYGKFLMQLPPGASFGELSFNANLTHSRRSAGVVSDGSHGQSRVPVHQEPGIAKSDFSVSKEVEATNVSILLLIPEKTYMSEMFARHSAKHQTKDKIAFLKASFLFKNWSMDQLVKMGYAMKKKQYSKGSVLVRQGDRADIVWILEKGKVSIVQHVQSEHRKRGQERRHRTSADGLPSDRVIDIAEICGNDIFGLVEVFSKSKKMKREGRVLQNLDVFIIPSLTFVSFMDQEPETAALLEKVVQKRVKWENLRKDYARRFSSMPFSLPQNASSMSNYSISQESVMSDTQIKYRKEQDLVLFRHMREARACFRSAISKAKNLKLKEASEEMNKASEYSLEARAFAEEMGDEKRKEQAHDLQKETAEKGHEYLRQYLESVGVSHDAIDANRHVGYRNGSAISMERKGNTEKMKKGRTSQDNSRAQKPIVNVRTDMQTEELNTAVTIIKQKPTFCTEKGRVQESCITNQLEGLMHKNNRQLTISALAHRAGLSLQPGNITTSDIIIANDKVKTLGSGIHSNL